MFVTTVDVRDLARLCEVRAVLEPEAARLAAERATQADLDELHELLAVLELRRRRRDDRWLIELDERIHRTIYRASHNQFLAETLERVLHPRAADLDARARAHGPAARPCTSTRSCSTRSCAGAATARRS